MRSSPVRIAFVADKISSPAGGTEQQILTLIRGLDRTRICPYLCVLQATELTTKEIEGSAAYELGISKVFSVRAFSRIARFARFLASEKIDILESHFIDGNIVGCAAATLLPRLVLVSARRNQGHWQTAAYRLLFSIFNRRVDLFLANCRATAEWASAREGIHKSRIRFIYNGVDLGRFAYDRRAAREEYRAQLNISPEVPVVGIVANLRPPKGTDIFLRAAAIVSRRLPAARFAIAGDGPLSKEMSALAHELGLGGRVLFLGTRDDVARLLAAFDVGVLSSGSESMPNSILEYMAASLPVVCTDVGGCREAVVDGETGYLVPPGDFEALAAGIVKALEGGLGREMGRKGRARVEMLFRSDAMVRNHERLYLRLAEAGRRGLPAGLAV